MIGIFLARVSWEGGSSTIGSSSHHDLPHAKRMAESIVRARGADLASGQAHVDSQYCHAGRVLAADHRERDAQLSAVGGFISGEDA